MTPIVGIRSALAVAALLLAGHDPAVAGVTERAMTIEGFGVTLVRPDKAGSTPLAVVIAGSGATDRDGNSVQGLATDAYKQLANALGELGIATVRYDKRGVAGSAELVRQVQPLTIDLYAKDVVAIAAWAKQLPNVASVSLIGHSEGGVLALMAARQANARTLVLLATPGRPLGAILREQVSKPGLPAELREEAARIITALERGEEVKTVGPALEPLFGASQQPYLKSWMKVDPVGLLKGLEMPTLVIGGSRDIQVLRADFDALTAARGDLKSQWFLQMGHTLKSVGEGLAAQQAAYADPTVPLAEGLAQRIGAFIQEAAALPRAKK